MSIISQTKAEMQERANQTDDQKRAFEKSLKRSVLALLNRIAFDFQTLYTATGDIIDARQYQEDLTSILRTSYRRTSSFFKNDYKRLIQDKIDDGEEELKPLLEVRNGESQAINASVLLFILDRARVQSDRIINTTNDIINSSIVKVNSEAIADGTRLTQSEVAKEAGTLIKNRSDGRATTISETEVQGVTEGSKDIEVVKLDEELQREQAPKRIEKTWITMGDSEVRTGQFNHRAANGQKKSVQDPYIVSGEFLKHPGDTSFGASIGNIVNCRCVSITS